ncbi:hypothetical protein AX15_000075 [Amanita polypyramis BW_CC]|nr:hypothetical protein AX15_000075 [Amanita polypyramis BW_CC]
MQSLNIQRSLLNPKFEGYRLELLPQDEAVVRYDLPYKPTQATVSGKMPLTFQEVQSRITHNHLALSSETDQAVYVDSANRLILIDLVSNIFNSMTVVDGTCQKANPPTFRAICDLPKPVQAPESQVRPEYPSALFFRRDIILLADGSGLLYVLVLKPDNTTDIAGVFTAPPDPIESPFRLHSLRRESPDVALVIVSSRYYDLNLASTQRSVGPGDVQFDVYAARIDLSTLHPDKITPLQVIWRRRGKEVPVYTGYVPTLDAFLLIGGSVYREADAPMAASYEPSPAEYAPIPRANENLDSEKQDPPRPRPYAWSQMSDSVTVAFPLPSSTPKSKIKILFSARTLILQVDLESSVDPLIPIPNYSSKLFWDDISPSTSFWTWDREAERSFGLLTLHLDKANEGTRWMQVFAAAATSTSQSPSPEDIEVPESLDPSEVTYIREALEKYTTAIHTGQDTSDLGFGTGMPSLAEGEMDEEIDQSVGREAYQTWISPDGNVPACWKNAREIPFHLLSTPIPGLAESDLTFIIKSHVDGAVLSLLSADTYPRWEHTSTFSALAFVLASKRDTRFTHHTGQAVFAFEGGVKDRGGNVYIYRVASLTSKWARQAILKVDDGRGGSLMGVGGWNSSQGLILVCLTEGELVLVKP